MKNDRLSQNMSSYKEFNPPGSFKTYKDSIHDETDSFTHVTLTVEGKNFLGDSSYQILLKQYTNDHDIFSITTGDDSLDSFEGYILENSKNILGKNITINFHRFGKVKQSFSGIITNIRNKKNKDGGYGKLYITGHSPSIFLENGKDCHSFENQTLEQIISEATQEYSQDGQITVVQPNTKYSIPYTVQYKESDYQFVKRLANRYGEYFYYDGQHMIFGNKVQPIVYLEENVDLIDVELELNIKSQEFNYMAYDSLSAEVKEKDSGSSIEQPKENTFQSVAINASKNVFLKKANMFFTGTSFNQTERDLDEMVKRQKESRQHLTKIKGKSRDPELKIAGIAKLIDINSRPMETYRIIEISHYFDGNEYYNEFLGVPDILISPFFDEEAFPVSEEQPATVTDNDNAQGMIRVQFPWQKKNGKKTPWLRVVTPYAGKGKGMHIIPEIGEEVVVGFENSNAERPFVYGSMFNGKENAGLGGPGNYMKGLQSAAGQLLQMNDKEGSFKWQDAVGSLTKLDGIGNSLSQVSKAFNVNAGKSLSNLVGGGKNGAPAQSKLNMDAAGNIVLNAQNSIVLQVGNSSITINNQEITIKSAKINMNADEDIKMNAQNTIEMKGGKTIEIDGKSEIKVTSDGTLEIKGKSKVSMDSSGTVEITSDGPTTIKGNDIELNKN